MKAFLDLETYSPVSIKAGTFKYAEQSEILLFAYAMGDEEICVWDVASRDQMPRDLYKILYSEDIELWFHNVQFDRTIFESSVFGGSPWPTINPNRWRCTMMQAMCHGLPGSLGKLCEIFKLGADVAKDKRGKQLINMFCKPQPTKQKLRRKTKETHPVEWAEFVEYAKSDVRAMRELTDKMPKWNYPNHLFELKLWQMSNEMNNRGVYVDLELAEKAIGATDLEQARLSRQISKATEGEVEKATQRDKLLEFIFREHGISLPDMRGATLERLLGTELPDGVRELLNIRLAASTSSVSKYKRVLESSNGDGYLRGLIQFSGAGRTGRDAGRLFQPQNMMRPTLGASEIEEGIEAIKQGCADLVTDNVMELCANTMRGVITAPPGEKLVIADLSNIEGRVLAWIAGEEWKLQAFRDFDNGVGPDLYCAAYGKAFGIDARDIGKNDPRRQIGKTLELAMGFGGGVGSFLTFALAFNLDLEKLTSGLSLPNETVAECENFWNWSIDTDRSTYGLPKEVFIACDGLKRLWRAAHPSIVTLWKKSDEAFRDAISAEDENFAIGEHCHSSRKGNWLRLTLPSGRSLSYPSPKVEEGKISFMGINQFNRKWSRISTYGGKLSENLTQAMARDVFKSSYPAIETSGYSIRLPVHDENITYARDAAEYSSGNLCKLMATAPAWAAGLPLAAAGFEAARYKKG